MIRKRRTVLGDSSRSKNHPWGSFRDVLGAGESTHPLIALEIARNLDESNAPTAALHIYRRFHLPSACYAVGSVVLSLLGDGRWSLC
jgi:hypothetical protein